MARALLIGLDRDPEAAPAFVKQFVVGKQGLEYVELEVEPVGFLRVDGEMDAGFRRLERELANHRNRGRKRFFGVAPLETRVERGQLDRDAGRFAEAPFACPAIRSSAPR